MRTLETFKEESRSVIRKTVKAMVDNLFPGGDLDEFAEVRPKLEALEERIVAESIEAVVGICADVYAIPKDVLRVHCHLEEDGVQSKGTNVVAKITAFRNDTNWMTMGKMAGKSVELVCLEDACATPVPEKSPAAESAPDPQGELPNIDAPLVDLYFVVDTDGNELHDVPLPLAEAEAHKALIAENLPAEHAAGLRLVKAEAEADCGMRNAECGLEEGEKEGEETGESADDVEFDDDGDGGELDAIPLSTVKMYLGENWTDKAFDVFFRWYRECVESGAEDFDEVIEDNATLIRNEMNRIPTGVVNALVLAAERCNMADDDNCRWMVASAVVLAHRMFKGASESESMRLAFDEFYRVSGYASAKEKIRKRKAAAV